ncbi:putative ribonuclease H-like domain-containing protein [Tanacetum coccineum]
MASTAAKPCQEDSYEFYLITGSIYTDYFARLSLAGYCNEIEWKDNDEILLRLGSFNVSNRFWVGYSNNNDRILNEGLLDLKKVEGCMVRAPRNQDNKNKESLRRSVPMEISSSTALVSCYDLGGYDWSDQAEEGPNYVLMDYSSSSSDLENMVLKVVLMKSGLVSINTARQNISKTAVSVNTARQVNTAHSKTTVNAARPMSYLYKTAHSTVKRPINKNTSFKNSNINQRVNTVRGKEVNTARPKAVVNAVKGNNVNVVKASACWVWKPKTKVLYHVSKHNSSSITLKKFDCIDAQARSKHMTGNMSYLIEYEEIDGGYVAFGGNSKGGKIIGKGTIKTGNLDFENVSIRTGIENLVDHKVKVIRCDNGTEFKNKEMKGILRQYSIARTPQQNEVAKRRNKTLIEGARTMLADSKLPTTFWAEAVNTACYVQIECQ